MAAPPAGNRSYDAALALVLAYAIPVPERAGAAAERGLQKCIGSKRRMKMIRKLKSGGYRLYSRKLNPKTGRRRNLGTFKTREDAQRHERAVQFFKRHG
jgi:hypothetical protein